MLFILLLVLGLGFVVRSLVAGRRPHLAFMAGLGLLTAAFLAPGVASATADEDLTPVGPDAQQVDSAFLNLPPFWVSVILGAVIPVLTGLLTKVTTPAWVKYAITAVLSGVAGLVNVSLVDGGGAVISQSAATSAVLTFILSLAAYEGWKTVGVTSSTVTRTDGDGNVVTEPGKLAAVGVK
jgi:hypothetical protein